jgi:hypothetical protein
MYKASISTLYKSLMTFLFSLRVGVSCPPSIENSWGRILNFTILCAFEIAFLLAYSIPLSIICRNFEHFMAYSIVFAVDPLALM